MPNVRNIQSVFDQLWSAYPLIEVSEETILMYIKLLSDIPVADLQNAIDDCIKLSKWLPTIAEIRTCHEARTRYLRLAQIYPLTWLVAPERPQLPAEPEPVRILRDVPDLADAQITLKDGELQIMVTDMEVARKRLAWQVARRLRSAGLETGVRFVRSDGA